MNHTAGLQAPNASMTPLAEVVDQVLDWSERQHWMGWNKHDGLNSPVLWALCGWAKWPRIAAVQLVMRAPVNLRPWLGTRKTQNPKGLALFVQALVDQYRRTGGAHYLERARLLVDELAALRAGHPWRSNAWGYRYPWQDLGFFSPADTPNAVVTSFVCDALLDYHAVTGDARALDMVTAAIGFLLHDLPVLKETDEELCLAYQPVPMRMRVLDVSALIGALLARHGKLSGTSVHLATSRRLLAYVVNRQTERGAWFYTDPPGDSPIRHDNYHTGFILDALHRYMSSTQDRTWSEAYDHGLAFYAGNHFKPDGAPRWMSDRDYPFDIHGAAQGILTFSRHAKDYPGLARRVARWAVTNMYAPEGRFYYQKTRWLTKRFTLLRWCNAWMSRAIAALLLAETDQADA